MKYLIAVAGLMGMLAVASAAFTSHGLSKLLANGGVEPVEMQQRMDWAKTATDYLLIHSVALVACAAAALHFPSVKLLRVASGLLLLGVLLFSGSLFALALTGNALFASIAPWGGTTLILAWLLVAIGGFLAPGPSGERLA